jgi:H+/gluconate symporter-like permease
VIRILIGLAIIIGILGGIIAIALIVDRWAERREHKNDRGEEEDNGFS